MRLKEGSPKGRHVVIVDDLVQSGGTLIECQRLLKTQVPLLHTPCLSKSCQLTSKALCALKHLDGMSTWQMDLCLPQRMPVHCTGYTTKNGSNAWAESARQCLAPEVQTLDRVHCAVGVEWAVSVVGCKGRQRICDTWRLSQGVVAEVHKGKWHSRCLQVLLDHGFVPTHSAGHPGPGAI